MGSCHSDPQNGHKQAEYQEQKQINPGQRLPYSYKFQHSNNQSINSHSSQQLIPVGSLNGDQGKQFIEGMENNQEEIPNNDQIDPETSRITLPQNLLNESLRGLPQQADDPVGYHQPSSKLGKITNQQLEITKKMKQLLSKIGNFSLPQMDQAFTILPEIGVVQYENEIKYFGQYFKGKRQGLGKQTWGDGSFYQGYFLDDKIHGYGRLIYYNGDYYIDGIGKYVDTFGNEYEGEWQENQQNGKGVEQQSDGTFYEGEFRDGQKHGQGQLVTDEYDYVGEFRHNKMDGKGEIRWKDGRTYKGDFKENLLHGQGEFQWPHGASYIGSYAKSNQQGYGKMLFSDGQIYEGQWKNGLQDGKGFFTDKDGDQQKGFWKQGRLTQD